MEAVPFNVTGFLTGQILDTESGYKDVKFVVVETAQCTNISCFIATLFSDMEICQFIESFGHQYVRKPIKSKMVCNIMVLSKVCSKLA